MSQEGPLPPYFMFGFLFGPEFESSQTVGELVLQNFTQGEYVQ